MNMKSNPSITRLPGFGIIEIKGKDATDFCHAQFTIDVKNMEPHRCRFSAWCNPKGQVIATFLLIHLEDRLLLFIPAEMIETVCSRLRMFVLRSAVIVTDLTTACHCVGINGETASGQLPGLPAPDSGQVAEYNSAVIARVPETAGFRRILIEPVNAENPLTDAIINSLNEVPVEQWQVADIRSGIPWITAGTREQVLPQELNLDLSDALEYDKGCFPGQEIIARVHFRNRLKRRMYLATLDSPRVPHAGTRIYTDKDSRLAGIVINAVPGTENRALLLAVLSMELAGSSPLLPESDQASPLQLQPLPYAGA